MPEELRNNNFEEEIAQISRAIEEKRNTLERERGIIEEEEIAKKAIRTHIQEELQPSQAASLSTKDDDNKNYTDTLSEEDIQKINSLISLMREKGIKKAITEAREEDPFLLDAFHDVLVDKLYTELKNEGYI
jgi:hypothetical protein